MTLKIEHAGENIHAKYNRLEGKHKSQKNRGKRFLYVIRDFYDRYAIIDRPVDYREVNLLLSEMSPLS